MCSSTDPIALMSVAMTALEYNENDNVTLSCSFFKDLADPDVFPRVIWNGPSGYYRTRLATETTPTTFESTVTFTATRQYHGQFTCSVNDVGVGTIAAMFQLTVYCECPQSLSVRISRWYSRCTTLFRRSPHCNYSGINLCLSQQWFLHHHHLHWQ